VEGVEVNYRVTIEKLDRDRVMSSAMDRSGAELADSLGVAIAGAEPWSEKRAGATIAITLKEYLEEDGAGSGVPSQLTQALIQQLSEFIRHSR
jgi:hypothetical protein